MDKNILLDWEIYLKEQKNNKYINNREKFSKRFGKKNLLELFENGKVVLERTNKNLEDRFFLSFVGSVLNPLKEKSGIFYIKKSTYSSLMSIFSKFVYFLREYQEKQKEILSIDIQKGKETQTETKESIIMDFGVPKTEQIRSDEEDIFKMDNEGNILPPDKQLEIINIDYKKKEDIKNTKTKKKKGFNGQMIIDFDDD